MVKQLVHFLRVTQLGKLGQRKQNHYQNNSGNHNAQDILSRQAAEKESQERRNTNCDSVGQLGHDVDHVVAGGAGGGEDGGIGDGGALVAEQTAADDRANHKRNGNIKGNGHGEGDGHHNGPHTPGGAGCKGNERAKQEHKGRNQAGSQVVLYNVDQELAGAHAFDDGTQRPGTHQYEGDGNELGHAVDKGVKGLGHAEQLGAHTHNTGAHRAAHKGDADGQRNVRVAEALHQPIVDQIAGPENGGKEGTKQEEDRDNKVPHGELIALGQLIFHLRYQGLDPVAQQFSGLPSPLFFLVHRPEVQTEGGDDQNGDHGKYAVQVKGEHIQPDAPLAALNAGSQQFCGNQAGDEGAVAADGRQGSQVTTHRVQDIGQLCPGNTHHVGHGPHNGTQHKAGLRVAENEGAQAGDYLALFGGIDDFCHLGGKCLRGAGGAQHGDHAAGEGNQDDQRRVSAERGDHIVRDNFDKANQRIKSVHHGGAQPNCDKQRENRLLGPQGQPDGYDGGDEAQHTICGIHTRNLLS